MVFVRFSIESSHFSSQLTYVVFCSPSSKKSVIACSVVLRLDVDRKPIVRQVDAEGECCLDGFVEDFVGDVCEVCAGSADALCDGNRLVDSEMSRVGFQAKRIQDEHVQVVEQVKGCRGYSVAVSTVGSPSKAIAVYTHRPVCKGNGFERDIRDREGLVVDLSDVNKGNAALVWFILSECVTEYLSDVVKCFDRHIQGNRAARCVVEGSQVVETSDVVEVVVCIDDAIETGDVVRKTLLSEIA